LLLRYVTLCYIIYYYILHYTRIATLLATPLYNIIYYIIYYYILHYTHITTLLATPLYNIIYYIIYYYILHYAHIATLLATPLYNIIYYYILHYTLVATLLATPLYYIIYYYILHYARIGSLLVTLLLNLLRNESRLNICIANLGLQMALLLLQLRADSAGSQDVPETEVALQQRQCLDPETRLTILVVQDTRCLGRRSECAWIRESGQDANLCAVSVIYTVFPDVLWGDGVLSSCRSTSECLTSDRF
jgi:hypothetical protein